MTSKSSLVRDPWLSTESYHHFWVLQSQPLSRWIMIFGLGLRLLSLMPHAAECSRAAMLYQEEVPPRGQRRPVRISLPIEIMDGDRPADA